MNGLNQTEALVDSHMIAILCAFFGGVLFPIASVLNGQFAAVTQSVLFSALVAELSGSLVLAGLLATGRLGGVAWDGLKRAPRWCLAGCFFGMFFVLCGTSVIATLGTTLTIAILLGSQILMGFGIDSFGWFGCDRTPFNRRRQVASLLILVGLTLLAAPALIT
jgi:bacterial/archaeal transporter family-2 protein